MEVLNAVDSSTARIKKRLTPIEISLLLEERLELVLNLILSGYVNFNDI